MLESLLRVPDLCWHHRDLRPVASPAEHARPGTYDGLAGRFAVADRVGDQVVLVRDPLGLNKLFFAVHQDHGVVAASYLADLRAIGVPFEAIYAVPAGTLIEIDPRRQTLTCRRLHHLSRRSPAEASDLSAALDRIRTELDCYFGHLRRQFAESQVAVCLSGGLDSALVAAFASEHLSDITAYTYSYTEGGAQSADVSLAQRTASHLGLPSRLVQAGPADVLGALHDSVRFGQDWRDFNVHAAIVNVLLADAVARDARAAGRTSPTIVLTGDLMNELLADYTPVRYRDHDYYRLPAISHDALRLALTRGIQAGDREVGVFQSRDLTAVQPYAAVFRRLLDLPGTLAKPDLIRGVADGRLPAAFYERVKARAQIGDTQVRSGILPLLADSGRDAQWLERLACNVLDVQDQRALRNFIRAGAYRSCQAFPGSRCGRSGYLSV
jgi:asparagine synthetase B (glutamine-hydrolysing)